MNTANASSLSMSFVSLVLRPDFLGCMFSADLYNYSPSGRGGMGKLFTVIPDKGVMNSLLQDETVIQKKILK